MLPSNSATPTNLAPSSVKNLEAQYPTLPKPCKIKVLPFIPLYTPNFLDICGWFKTCLAA